MTVPFRETGRREEMTRGRATGGFVLDVIVGVSLTFLVLGGSQVLGGKISLENAIGL